MPHQSEFVRAQIFCFLLCITPDGSSLFGSLQVRDWINTSHPPSQMEERVEGRPCPNADIHRSTTDCTLVNSVTDSPSRTPGPSSPAMITCLPPPPESKIDVIEHVGRSAVVSPVSSKTLDTDCRTKELPEGGVRSPANSLSSRKNLVRLFSGVDDMDEYFDGKPPSFSRQASSTSQFDELFDDDNLDSFSMFLPNATNEAGDLPEPPTPTNGRNMLFKVMKESGFHQHASNSTSQPQADSSECGGKEPKGPAASNCTPLSPVNAGEDQFRPRNLSLSKVSSRCSTPQTIMG